MEYFRIKNWDRYQHRDATRNGRMPWIKLYTSILLDYKMTQLSPSEMGIWVRLMLITGEIGNKIPLDLPWLRPRLAPVKFHKRLNLQFMWDLGLIENWSAGLDKDEDKTKTKTKTLPRQPALKNSDPIPRKSGWVNPAQERLANNMEVAKRAMQRSNPDASK